MKTDLPEWHIEQAADGAWHAAAPGFGVSLEGDGGLVELMAGAGLLAVEGSPAGRQEAFSLAMDRALHKIIRTAPKYVVDAFKEAIERTSDLKVSINTPGSPLRNVSRTADAARSSAAQLESSIDKALSSPVDPELQESWTGTLMAAAGIAAGMISYASKIAGLAGIHTSDTINPPWTELASQGDEIVIPAMRFRSALEGISTTYEERWLVGHLDGVHVYVMSVNGFLHVLISKQILKPRHQSPSHVKPSQLAG